MSLEAVYEYVETPHLVRITGSEDMGCSEGIPDPWLVGGVFMCAPAYNITQADIDAGVVINSIRCVWLNQLRSSSLLLLLLPLVVLLCSLCPLFCPLLVATSFDLVGVNLIHSVLPPPRYPNPKANPYMVRVPNHVCSITGYPASGGRLAYNASANQWLDSHSEVSISATTSLVDSDGVFGASADDTIEYEITLSNMGTTTLKGIHVSDPILDEQFEM